MKKHFEKAVFEIISLEQTDIIVTSVGIPFPDDEWEEE